MSNIKISIVSSSEEIYSGEATMVFATGSLGELGIAPGHTPLLTGLAPGPVRVQNGSEEETFFFLQLCRSYGLKNISGLMCIPPINEDPKKHFRLICDLSQDLGLGNPSIGMSSDYLEALEFNPQYIRLGTVLFGKRI